MKDRHNPLKNLFESPLQSMPKGILYDQPEYDNYERTEELKPNSRNGHSQKTVTTSYGDVDIQIPGDSNIRYLEYLIGQKLLANTSGAAHNVLLLYFKHNQAS